MRLGVVVVAVLVLPFSGCLLEPQRFEVPPVPETAKASWSLVQDLAPGAGVAYFHTEVYGHPEGDTVVEGYLRATSYPGRPGLDFIFAQAYFEQDGMPPGGFALVLLAATDGDMTLRAGRDGDGVLAPTILRENENAEQVQEAQKFSINVPRFLSNGTRLVVAVAYDIPEGDAVAPKLEFVANATRPVFVPSPDVRRVEGVAGAHLLSHHDGFTGSYIVVDGAAPLARIEGAELGFETQDASLVLLAGVVLRDANARANGGTLDLEVGDGFFQKQASLGGSTDKSSYVLGLHQPAGGNWTVKLAGEGVVDVLLLWADIPMAFPIYQEEYA